MLKAALPANEIKADVASADGTGGGVGAQPAKPGDSNLGPNGTATPAGSNPDSGTANGSRRCGSRRLFTIRLKEPRRGQGKLRSARVTVDGKRIKVRRRNGRLTARVDLRRKNAKTVKVRIVARTSRGRTVRSTRTYLTCRKKR